MNHFDLIPPALREGEKRERWETRREVLLNSIAVNEYGVRPDIPYTVSWEDGKEDAFLNGKCRSPTALSTLDGWATTCGKTLIFWRNLTGWACWTIWSVIFKFTI